MDFAKGEVVVLRSGGDSMTIRTIGKKAFGRQPIWCIWMAKGKKFEAAFDAEVLVKCSESAPAGHLQAN